MVNTEKMFDKPWQLKKETPPLNLMVMYFHNATIRRKLVLMIGVSVLLALFVITTAIIAYEYLSRCQQTEQ